MRRSRESAAQGRLQRFAPSVLCYNIRRRRRKESPPKKKTANTKCVITRKKRKKKKKKKEGHSRWHAQLPRNGNGTSSVETVIPLFAAALRTSARNSDSCVRRGDIDSFSNPGNNFSRCATSSSVFLGTLLRTSSRTCNRASAATRQWSAWSIATFCIVRICQLL